LLLQANTFTLAGYETTANALAFALWCISTHPEAEAQLLQEAAAATQPFHAYSRDLEQQVTHISS
jgi:cytochrome P450